MRLHRHQLGRANRWHSVRAHHDDAWDWCAHHEEIEYHLAARRHEHERIAAGEHFELQPASP